MNTLLWILMGALFVFALYRTVSRVQKGSECCGEHEQSIKRNGPRDKHKKHYSHEAVVDITGMTCNNCAVRVENALNRIDGIWAAVSIDSQKARIRSKAPLDSYAIKDTIIKEGYGAGEITIKR